MQGSPWLLLEVWKRGLGAQEEEEETDRITVCGGGLIAIIFTVIFRIIIHNVNIFIYIVNTAAFVANACDCPSEVEEINERLDHVSTRRTTVVGKTLAGRKSFPHFEQVNSMSCLGQNCKRSHIV